MNNLVDGKVAIITGGGSGIGKSVCELFAQQGAKVVVIDKDLSRAEKTSSSINDNGGDSIFIQADVSNSTDCINAVIKACEVYRTIDILFNNAGTTRRATILDTTEEEWERVIDVNLKGTFLMSKYVIPVMIENGGGRIVNNASGWGLVGGSKAVSYCASKGGVVLLTKALALDHGQQNINVNCICPGDTDTNMLVNEARQLDLSDDELVKDGINRPLGRIGQASEIAGAVLFLCSPYSSFVTGAELIVDGGGLAGSA